MLLEKIKYRSKSSTFICVEAEEFGNASADYFSNILKTTKNPTVVLPTGFTPIPFYREIVSRYKSGQTFLNEFTYLALDEYLGLPDGDYCLFSSWLDREVLGPLSIPDERRILFNSATSDSAAECDRIEKIVTQTSIDIAIIGLGGNGHVGFNEPGSSHSSRARKILLTEETREANSEYWGSLKDVPTHALTLGLGTLRKAKKTLLLVSGKRKAAILKRTFTEDISEKIPSTYLQKLDNLTVIADKDAMSELEGLGA